MISTLYSAGKNKALLLGTSLFIPDDSLNQSLQMQAVDCRMAGAANSVYSSVSFGTSQD